MPPQEPRSPPPYPRTLLIAVTGCTAAELVSQRLDAESHTLGLTTWQGEAIRKADVTVAKNYLSPTEVDDLNRLTTMFLDVAEDRAKRKQVMTMADWVDQTDRFLVYHERPLLAALGQVTHEQMKQEALAAYEDFDHHRREVEAAVALVEEAQDLAALLAVAEPDVGTGE